MTRRRSPRELESILEDLEEKPVTEWSIEELMLTNLQQAYAPEEVDDPVDAEEFQEAWNQAVRRLDEGGDDR